MHVLLAVRASSAPWSRLGILPATKGAHRIAKPTQLDIDIMSFAKFHWLTSHVADPNCACGVMIQMGKSFPVT